MDKCTESKALTGLLITPSWRWWTCGLSLRFRHINGVCPFVSAAEAGLFKDGDGDQHSPHRPVAHHWCHAEWLWGIQPEVRLWGRLRLLPRLDAPRLPAEGQGQRVDINSHMLRSNHLCLPNPQQAKKKKNLSTEKTVDEECPPRPCHESAGQGKLLLALVGPESRDFTLREVTGVRSGRRACGVVLDRVDPVSLNPPTPPPLSLWMLLVLLWIQPQRCLCEESQKNQGARNKTKKKGLSAF